MTLNIESTHIDIIRRKYASDLQDDIDRSNNDRTCLRVDDIAWKYLKNDLHQHQQEDSSFRGSKRVSFAEDISDGFGYMGGGPGMTGALRIIDNLKRMTADYARTDLPSGFGVKESIGGWMRPTESLTSRTSVRDLKRKRKDIDKPSRQLTGKSRSKSPHWSAAEIERLMLIDKGRESGGGGLNREQLEMIVEERWRKAQEGAKRDGFGKEREELRKRLVDRGSGEELKRLKIVYSRDIAMVQRNQRQREVSRENGLRTKAVGRIFLKGIKNEDQDEFEYDGLELPIMSKNEEIEASDDKNSNKVIPQNSISSQKLSKAYGDDGSHFILPISLGLKNQDNTVFNLSYSKDEDSPSHSRRFIPTDLISVYDGKTSYHLPQDSNRQTIPKANTQRIVSSGLSQFSSQAGNLTQRSGK